MIIKNYKRTMAATKSEDLQKVGAYYFEHRNEFSRSGVMADLIGVSSSVISRARNNLKHQYGWQFEKQGGAFKLTGITFRRSDEYAKNQAKNNAHRRTGKQRKITTKASLLNNPQDYFNHLLNGVFA